MIAQSWSYNFPEDECTSSRGSKCRGPEQDGGVRCQASAKALSKMEGSDARPGVPCSGVHKCSECDEYSVESAVS